MTINVVHSVQIPGMITEEKMVELFKILFAKLDTILSNTNQIKMTQEQSNELLRSIDAVTNKLQGSVIMVNETVKNLQETIKGMGLDNSEEARLLNTIGNSVQELDKVADALGKIGKLETPAGETTEPATTTVPVGTTEEATTTVAAETTDAGTTTEGAATTEAADTTDAGTTTEGGETTGVDESPAAGNGG